MSITKKNLNEIMHIDVICNPSLNRRAPFSVYCMLVNVEIVYNPLYKNSGVVSCVKNNLSIKLYEC